jgi:hypothetical protein
VLVGVIPANRTDSTRANLPHVAAAFALMCRYVNKIVGILEMIMGILITLPIFFSISLHSYHNKMIFSPLHGPVIKSWMENSFTYFSLDNLLLTTSIPTSFVINLHQT